MGNFVSPYQINQLRQQGQIVSSGQLLKNQQAYAQTGVPQVPQSGVAQPGAGGYQSTPVTGPIASTAPGGSVTASKNAALARLEQVGGGQNKPIGDAEKAGMMSAQSDMSAAAEAQQNAALRRTTAAGGGSLYDPSHGAAERENAADRQGANQEAKRDIDLKAAGTNYEAEFAANRLLAAQEDPYSGGGGSYGSGSVGAPSATPGGDRVQGYSGQFDLSQGKLTTTNPDRSSVGLRTPTTTRQPTGGQAVQGGPTQSSSPQEQASWTDYQRRSYNRWVSQGYDDATARRLSGVR
jgi:hypothetical protein